MLRGVDLSVAPGEIFGLAAALRVNPLAHAVSAVRRALAGPAAPGALPGSAASDLAVCALFAAVALAVAVLVTRRPARS